MRQAHSIKVLTALALTSAFSAQADDTIVAYIKTVSGKADIISGQTTQAASVGAAVHDQDRIKTEDDASVGLTFKDNTVLSLGPNSQLTVDEFVYAPEQSQLKLAVNLLSGTLQYVSGMIAKLKPQAVEVKTPTGMIGVRGTRFVVKVGDE